MEGAVQRRKSQRRLRVDNQIRVGYTFNRESNSWGADEEGDIDRSFSNFTHVPYVG